MSKREWYYCLAFSRLFFFVPFSMPISTWFYRRSKAKNFWTHSNFKHLNRESVYIFLDLTLFPPLRSVPGVWLNPFCNCLFNDHGGLTCYFLKCFLHCFFAFGSSIMLFYFKFHVKIFSLEMSVGSVKFRGGSVKTSGSVPLVIMCGKFTVHNFYMEWNYCKISCS